MLLRLFAWERGSVPELPTCVSRASFADSVPTMAPHLYRPPPTSPRLFQKGGTLRLLGRTSATMDPWHRRIDAKLRSRHLRRWQGERLDEACKLEPGGACGDRRTWGRHPLGCSALSGGDWTAHYKTSGDQGPGCIGEIYQLVCSGFGKPTVLIWTEPSSGGKEERQGWCSGTRAERLFRMFRSGGIAGHSLSTRAGKCPCFPLFRHTYTVIRCNTCSHRHARART